MTRRKPAPPADMDDASSRLEAIISIGVEVMEEEMRAWADPPAGGVGRSADSVDRVIEITEKASEIVGRIHRAREAAARRKLSVSAIQKGIANLSPDERAHLMETLGLAGKDGNSLS